MIYGICIYIYIYHLVICYIAMENHHAINRSTIYFNGPFSMAMLNNQRVYTLTIAHIYIYSESSVPIRNMRLKSPGTSKINPPKVPPKKPWCRTADFDLGLPEFSQAASSLHKPSSLDGRRSKSWVRSWDKPRKRTKTSFLSFYW